ncbi:glycoside hydrolase family 88 protein [Cellulosilyticum sp. I15G10I2]|uniref:glycoside hydrolase family 88 protein n=1 Tax=Cellulosilyticum sp. I15G10I2 TaxID=1892843 RepID=UPI00085C7E64|nr:glycoside hydrolase family 88 protein [Cellulosilyticum sp. I15G10I2]
MEYGYSYVKKSFGNNMPVPVGKRAPFSWPTTSINANGEKTILFFDNMKVDAPYVYLRLTIAIDIREDVILEVSIPDTESILGMIDIRYGVVFQPFELKIPKDECQKVMNQGIAIRMIKGTSNIYFFNDTSSHFSMNQKLNCHLMFANCDIGNQKEMIKTLCSRSSIQLFGWMEGCVMDGIYDLKSMLGGQQVVKCINDHYKLFLDHKERLSYENPRSQPILEKMYGIEGMLPFAILGKTDSRHPKIDWFLEELKQFINNEGMVLDEEMISAEGSYTIAYPLAVISVIKNDIAIAEMAVQQVMNRMAYLRDEGSIYLRYYMNGDRTFKNWGRAYTWYTLGQIQTLMALGTYVDHPLIQAKTQQIKKDFVEVIHILKRLISNDGMWYCFVDDASTLVDTSATAGIAAAMAKGYYAGLLEVEELDIAKKAAKALEGYLTVDGWLAGVSQSNKNGEYLQRSGYRVISQMANGLYGQLVGTLHRIEMEES